MINKYAEIRDRLALYNACKGVLRVKLAYNTIPENSKLDKAVDNLSMVRKSLDSINNAAKSNARKLTALEPDHLDSYPLDRNPTIGNALWNTRKQPVSAESIVPILKDKNSTKFDPIASLKSIRRQYPKVIRQEMTKDKQRRNQFNNYVDTVYAGNSNPLHGLPPEYGPVDRFLNYISGATTPTVPKVHTQLDYNSRPKRYV